MSKSKKNIVALDNILENYGADTARLFVLSDSPVDKDLIWSSSALSSCFKFLSKLLTISKSIIDLANSMNFDVQNFLTNSISSSTSGEINSLWDINLSKSNDLLELRAKTHLLIKILPQK